MVVHVRRRLPALRCSAYVPTDSDDLSAIVEPQYGVFQVLVSPLTAEHTPDYEMVAAFVSLPEAEAFALGVSLPR
jgi:hypothetical protein